MAIRSETRWRRQTWHPLSASSTSSFQPMWTTVSLAARVELEALEKVQAATCGGDCRWEFSDMHVGLSFCS
jgi:hypothetical protein